MEKIELACGAIFYQKTEEQKEKEKKEEEIKEKLKDLTGNKEELTTLKQSERIAKLEQDMETLKTLFMQYVGT